jgi:hypothetical protein
MAGEKTKQIGVAHQHKHNRNKQNRKTQKRAREPATTTTWQHNTRILTQSLFDG